MVEKDIRWQQRFSNYRKVFFTGLEIKLDGLRAKSGQSSQVLSLLR